MKASAIDQDYKVFCLRIEPVHASAPVVRLTSFPKPLTMQNDEVYLPDSGYQFTGIEQNNDMSSGSIDLEGILGSPGVTRDQIASKMYDNARVYLFATAWSNPIEDEEPISKLLLGKVSFVDDTYRAELMHLIDAVSQTVTDTYTAGCPHTLGDSRCKVDLQALEEATTILSVTSQKKMQVDSAMANDWYAYGSVEFATGANAGLGARQIKTADGNGNIELFHPFQYNIEPDDQVVLRPGCRKRPKSDCKEKFNNKINFGGFEYVPRRNEAAQWGKN